MKIRRFCHKRDETRAKLTSGRKIVYLPPTRKYFPADTRIPGARFNALFFWHALCTLFSACLTWQYAALLTPAKLFCASVFLVPG